MCAKQPEDRYQGPAELIAALGAAGFRPGETRAAGTFAAEEERPSPGIAELLAASATKDTGMKTISDITLETQDPDMCEFLARRRRRRFVKSLAKRLGIPFRGTHAKVVQKRGESVEMAARRVRLAFFAKSMKSLRLDAVATGHHMDDVAETFLMKLRRASLSGIRATSEVAGIKFVRPLLGCRDDELKDYLRKFGEEWREDASNDDVSIERNKVRHEVIPFMEKVLDANLVEHLYRISQRL